MKHSEPRDVWSQEHRLMVAIEAGLSSEKTLVSAQKLAQQLNAPWIAVHVKPSVDQPNREHLRVNRCIALARELGAEVITTSDEDVISGFLRIALEHKVTQILVGKTAVGLGGLFKKSAELGRLRRVGRQVGISIVEINEGTSTLLSFPWRKPSKSTLLRYLIASGAVLGATVADSLLEPVIGHRAISFIYLLVVVAFAPFLGRGPTLFAAATSALCWDFFFTRPVYSFLMSSLEDQIMLGIYFFVALVLGQLTARIREQEINEREREERTTALHLLTRELTSVANVDELVRKVAQQLKRAFDARIVVFLPNPFNRIEKPHPSSSFQPQDEELRVADWAFENGQPAGQFTENLQQAEALYMPLLVGGTALGVIGLEMDPDLIPAIVERNMLNGLAQQIALALERLRLQEASEKTRLLAESERLSNALLDSISHEIRTPLAVIESATCHLVEYEKAGLTSSQLKMMAEIREATDRLNGVVGNVLNINRLESGHTKPKFAFCDVREMIVTALEATRKKLSGHVVTVDVKPGIPPVNVDAVLMHHAITNLLSNAAFHTPAGTAVHVSARTEAEWVAIEVADSGPGIHPESIERVFDKFHRAVSAPRGGIGLGLSIVRGFVEAQGGQVRAENRAQGGAVFTIRLPLDLAANLEI